MHDVKEGCEQDSSEGGLRRCTEQEWDSEKESSEGGLRTKTGNERKNGG